MSCRKNADRASRAARAGGIAPTSSQSGFAGPTPQLSFFELDRVESPVKRFAPGPAINLADHFSEAELGQIGVQLRLGVAAVERYLRERRAGLPHSPDQRDPRPPDWARLDRRHYRWLAGQVRRGVVETGSLKSRQLTELWTFCRFEGERALRNLDRFTTPGDSISGPTAAYLAENQRLLARFYHHLAGQVEPLLSGEAKEAVLAWA
jgi:hypothetical protein